MLNNNIKVYLAKYSLVTFIGLLFTACAHQSGIKPSAGHIDGKAATQDDNKTAAAAPIPKLVRSSPQLPPPKATTKAQTYSVVVNEVPVKEILFALARESKINVDIHPSIQGRATLNAVDQTLPAILERLAKQVDLTYKMDGNVLYIAPDQPVLRNYKIDYVNMNRDTKSFIGADGQISSSAQIGDSTTTNGNGANNSSRTSVDSTSKNHLWESLILNIKDLLAETDKEVIVTRIGTAGQSNNQADVKPANANGTTITINTQSDAAKAEAEDRERAKSEYKTLFAANVIANAETGVISVRATNKQHQKVQEFIDKVMGSARRQVLIEATIVEVRLSDSFQAGIDWSRLNNGPTNSGFVFGQTLGSKGFNFNPKTGAVSQGGANALGITSTAGLFAGYLNPASAIGNIAASITLLKQFGDTKVLSSPKLMVLNNQTAVLKVVDNLVYFTVQAQQSQASVGGSVLSTITTTPNTVPVGVVMSVTPQINDTGNVNINVRPTISRVLSFVRDPNPQLLTIPSQIPQIQVREMESILQVSSGSTAVLGGLMQDEIQRNSDKVPGLSNIPGIGKLFTGKNDANQKTELVIFLRPTVIPSASLESDELQSYKQYLPEQQLQNVLEEAN
ncbi:MAG: pilus (MSHA type) biogenesis protein MshL [Methylotenera sp.]